MIRSKRCMPLFLFVLAMLYPVCAHGTDLFGTIENNTTLTVSESPYYVTGNTITTGHLSIEAGVSIEFNGNFSFTINGLLTANGTSSNRIWFRNASANMQGKVVLNVSSPYLCQASYWKLENLNVGIELTNGFQVSEMQALNCATGFVVSNGGTINGFSATGCSRGVTGSSNGTIMNGVISSSVNEGVLLSDAPYYTISNVEITGSGTHGISTPTTGSGNITISGCDIHDNGLSGSYSGISGATSTSTISTGGPYNTYITIQNTEVYANSSHGIRLAGYELYSNGYRYRYVHCNIVSSSIFSNGGNGVNVSSYVPTMQIQSSNLLVNSGHTISASTSYDYDAIDNWWGTTDGMSIRSRVNGASVSYVPFLDAENGNSTHGTYLQGIMIGNRQLTGNNTYTVLGETAFGVNDHLEIEAGTQIVFAGNHTLRVDGLLTANGTSSNRIWFRNASANMQGKVVLNVSSPYLCQASYWKLENLNVGIELTNGFQVSEMQALNCATGFVVSNGGTINGFSATGCSRGVTGSSNGTIMNGVISSSVNEGVLLSDAPYYTISNVEITGSGTHGISTPTTGSGNITISGCDIHDNGLSGSYSGISGATSTSTISTGGPYNTYITIQNTEVYANSSHGIRLAGYELYSNGYRYRYVHCNIVSSSIFSNGGNGVNVSSYVPTMQIQSSNLLVNSGHTISASTSYDYDAIDNWWGTTDGMSIRSRVNGASVSYVPFLDAENGNSTHGTYLQGIMIGNRQLTGNNTYTVLGETAFGVNDHLEIEAGTQIVFAGNHTLRVDGLLTANGTSSNRIWFRNASANMQGKVVLNVSSPYLCQASYWKLENLNVGIELTNGFQVSEMQALNCATGFVVSNGGTINGFSATGCSRGVTGSSNGTIMNGVISSSVNEGVLLSDAPYYTISNVEITGSGTHGISTPTTGSGNITISGCDIHDNGLSGSYSGISGATSTSTISTGGPYNTYITIQNTEVYANSSHGIRLAGYELYSNGYRYRYVHCNIVSSSIFSNGGNGVNVSSYVPTMQIQSSNLLVNSGHTISASTSYDYDAIDNWWGTTDGMSIRSRVNGASVSYVPFLDAENGNSTHGTYLQGIMIGNRQLTGNNTYTVLGETAFGVNDHLEIEAGTQIVFAGNHTLRVDGLLTANGTSSNRIWFRNASANMQGKVVLNVSSPYLCQASYWKLENLNVGIELTNGFQVSEMQALNCATGFVVSNGGTINGFSATGCSRGVTGSSNGTIMNGVISSSVNEGVLLSDAPYYTISNVEITGSGTHGISTPTTGSGNITISGCDIHDNGLSGSYSGISGATSTSTISTGGSYNTYITIQNTEVYANSSHGIRLAGYELYSNGYRYRYVHCNIVSSSIFSNGGNGVITNNYAYMDIDRALVENNNGIGVVFRGNGNTELFNNRIINNGGYGLQILTPGTSISVRRCALYNNGTYDLYNDTNAAVTAAHNYWLLFDAAAISERIYDYYDNSAKGIVSFNPYLNQPPDIYLPADFNRDGRVDGFDLALLGVSFGSEPADNNWNPLCDLNNSGRVDGFDLAIFSTYFGQIRDSEPADKILAGSILPINKVNKTSSLRLAQLEDSANHSKEYITFHLSLSQASEALALAFDLVYNPELLQLVDIQDLSSTSQGGDTVSMYSADVHAGRIIMGYTLLNRSKLLPDVETNLYELRFRVIDSIRSGRIRFENVGLIDSDGVNQLPIVTYDATINATEGVPKITQLKQNYPNPFNPSTNIEFYLGDPQIVRLVIYNAKGEIVRTLVNESLSADTHILQWDGRDFKNQAVASGIYFYALFTDKANIVKKMLLLK